MNSAAAQFCELDFLVRDLLGFRCARPRSRVPSRASRLGIASSYAVNCLQRYRFFSTLLISVATGISICRNMARVCGWSVPSNCPHSSSE